jgi:hypothetical protein
LSWKVLNNVEEGFRKETIKMQNKALKLKEVNQLLNKISIYDSSTGEFLLPIINTPKSLLKAIKKMFDGTSFMLNTVNMEKVADNCYMLVLKGKKHDSRD